MNRRRKEHTAIARTTSGARLVRGTGQVCQASLTTMPVEYLHDLTGLQVPDKDLAILTSTDDILSLRRRRYKRIWDAIGSINVTSVRLHTA
jgi:hypothetical protein